MKTLGNIIWLVLAGVWLCIAYVIAGALNCLTIVGIPFGLQSFKIAGYVLWPFGRTVVKREDRSKVAGCVGNTLWLVLAGWWLALVHIVAGALLCLTIVGIPLGIACFKMISITLAPFGKEVVRASAVKAGEVAEASVSALGD